MGFSKEGKILINSSHELKGYSAKRLIKEFLQREGNCVNYLLKMTSRNWLVLNWIWSDWHVLL